MAVLRKKFERAHLQSDPAKINPEEASTISPLHKDYDKWSLENSPQKGLIKADQTGIEWEGEE